MCSLNTGTHDTLINMNIITKNIYWNKLFDLFINYLQKYANRTTILLNQNTMKLDIQQQQTKPVLSCSCRLFYVN